MTAMFVESIVYCKMDLTFGQFAFKCRMGRARLIYGEGTTAAGWAM